MSRFVGVCKCYLLFIPGQVSGHGMCIDGGMRGVVAAWTWPGYRTPDSEA